MGRFGICAKSGAERTPRELRGPILRSVLGPRSSGSERLKQLCMFQVHRAPQVQSGTFALAPLSCFESQAMLSQREMDVRKWMAAIPAVPCACPATAR
eukprot:4916441-Alexandrium_andersonii.AAC.1